MPVLHRLWKRLRSFYRQLVYSLALKHAARHRSVKIVIGANSICDPGWYPTEADFLNLLKPEQWGKIFLKNPPEAILAEHVWEHLTLDQGKEAARTCFRFLKNGGYLRIAVPDGLHPDPEYRERTKPGGSGPSADDHKLFYTYQSLGEVFQQAGFSVELLEYFDEKGHFHRKTWDPKKGTIRRSLKFDPRNHDGQPHYTSIILDAVKSTLERFQKNCSRNKC